MPVVGNAHTSLYTERESRIVPCCYLSYRLCLSVHLHFHEFGPVSLDHCAVFGRSVFFPFYGYGNRYANSIDHARQVAGIDAHAGDDVGYGYFPDDGVHHCHSIPVQGYELLGVTGAAPDEKADAENEYRCNSDGYYGAQLHIRRLFVFLRWVMALYHILKECKNKPY